MKRILTVAMMAGLSAGVAFAEEGAKRAGAGGQQMKLTQAQCESAWNQANPSNAATINESQARAHVTDFRAANPDNDGTIDRAEFMAACDKGLVRSSATTGAGGGTSGSEGMKPGRSGSESGSERGRY